MTWNKWSRKDPIKFNKPKVFNDPKVHTAKEIKEMLKQGMTSPQIAEELGIAASTVRTYIKDYGLKSK